MFGFMPDQGIAYHNPIATYTYTGNREVVISAVDIETNTFTSVGHQLNNGDKVCITFNEMVSGADDKINPIKYYPGNINHDVYYVINKTDDTFQLSTEIDGTAVDLTEQETMDLSKIHLEVASISAISIANLPRKEKIRAVVYFKLALRNPRGIIFIPSNFASNKQYINADRTTTDLTYSGYIGPETGCYGYVEAVFGNVNGHDFGDFSGVAAKLISSSDMSILKTKTSLLNIYKTNNIITGINFSLAVSDVGFIVNGTSMGVYNA